MTTRGADAGHPGQRPGPLGDAVRGVQAPRHRRQPGWSPCRTSRSTSLPAEFVCLVGASGCGKTTLLNLVAGLDRPTVGTVDGHRAGGAGQRSLRGSARRSVRPGGTATAMLFQDSALFPWLTVAANVELPMRLRGVGKAERRAVADDLLERVHLVGFGPKRPHELSGGMRQRAALARALAQDAGLLLMDEPFGALDAITRDLLHDELESLWLDRGFTVLFVTHNVREAARLGDTHHPPHQPARTGGCHLPGRPAPAPADRLGRNRRPGRHGHRSAPGGGGPPWPLTTR